MRSHWHLALCVIALAFTLLGGARRAEARKSLKDCPVYKALTSQRRSSSSRSSRSRSVRRYRSTRRTNLTTAGHITNGVKNVLIAPLDVPLTMRRVAAEKNIFAGLLGGSIEGMGNSLERIFGGTTEMIAAPIPGIRTPTYQRSLGADGSRSNNLGLDILSNIIGSK